MAMSSSVDLFKTGNGTLLIDLFIVILERYENNTFVFQIDFMFLETN